MEQAKGTNALHVYIKYETSLVGYVNHVILFGRWVTNSEHAPVCVCM